MRKITARILKIAGLSFMAFTSVVASPSHTIDFDISLKPHQAQRFDNPFFFEVKLACRVYTDDNPGRMHAELVKNNGSINGHRYHQGDSDTVDIHNGEHFDIKADGEAAFVLTTESERTVTAHCTF